MVFARSQQNNPSVAPRTHSLRTAGRISLHGELAPKAERRLEGEIFWRALCSICSGTPSVSMQPGHLYKI